MVKKFLKVGAIVSGLVAVGAIIVAVVEHMNSKRLEEMLEDELDDYEEDDYEEDDFFDDDHDWWESAAEDDYVCPSVENDFTPEDVKDIQAAVGGKDEECYVTVDKTSSAPTDSYDITEEELEAAFNAEVEE